MKKHPLIIIFLVVFVDLVGFGMVIPILPYYAKAFGATATTLGILMMCYSGMQFLFSPFWGSLSDRFGRRPVIMTCIAGVSISMVIVGYATSLAWLFVGRLLAGFFGANISAAAAYIADVTPPENRAKGMGLIGAAFGLGFLFGPAAGGLLSHWGYGTAALVAALLSAINFIFAAIKLDEPKLSLEERRAHRSRFTAALCWRTIAEPKTGLAIWLFFIVTLGIAQVETSFALFVIERFSLDVQHAGFILAVMAIGMITIQGGAIGPLVKRFGEAALTRAGMVVMAIALLVAGMSHVVVFFVVALFVNSLGYGITNPSLSGLVSRHATAGSQGATMGIFQSAGSLARVLGPLMAGVLFDRCGIQYPFYGATVFFLVGLGILMLHGKVWVKSPVISRPLMGEG